MAHNEEQLANEDHPQVKTILIVEDDVYIGEVLVQAISQETSYIGVLAHSGAEALEIVQGIRPNLFILDYQLPQMDGIALYDQLHTTKELTKVPAIMISARLPQQELKKRHMVGMNKPLDLDEFLHAIEQVLA